MNDASKTAIITSTNIEKLDATLVINPALTHVAGYLYGGEKPYNLIHKVVELLRPVTLLDIGCGPCASLAEYTKLGVACTGLDGDPQLLDNVHVQPYKSKLYFHDLETGPWTLPGNITFDIVWSYEVAEHISNADSFVTTCANLAGKYIIMSHAIDNIGGYHHVNGQPGEYWIDKFKAKSFKYEPELTDTLKQANRLDTNSCYFAGNHKGQGNGLVFSRLS